LIRREVKVLKGSGGRRRSWSYRLGKQQRAQGEEAAVKEVVDYCRHGPSFAKVENIDVVFEDFIGEFESFSIV
jgi:hypothetical protein